MQVFDIERAALRQQWCVPAYQVQHSLLRAGARHAMREVGELADIRSGTYISEYQEAGRPYLRVDNIREFQINENPEDLVFVARGVDGISKRTIVEEYDVLVARTGTLGKASLALSAQAGAVMSQHVTRLSCGAECAPGYLACCLNAAFGRSQLIAGGFGSTRLELTHRALGEIKIPWVDAATRGRISAAVCAGVEKNNTAMATLRWCVREMEDAIGIEVREGARPAIFEAVGVSRNPLWTPRYFEPNGRDGEIELERRFECVRLGRIASIERGGGTRVVDYAKEGIPFVRTTSLINFGIDPFPDHYATVETHDDYGQTVGEGDILYSIEGKIGMSGYILEGQKCVFKNHIERVRVREKLDPVAVFLFLSTRLAKLQAERNAVVQATLPGMASRLRELLIPVRKRGNQEAKYAAMVEGVCQRAREAFAEKAAAVEEWHHARGLLAEAVAGC